MSRVITGRARRARSWWGRGKSRLMGLDRATLATLELSLMKTLSTFFLIALLTVTCPAQQTATGTEPTTDPRALLTSAAQFYRLGEQGQHPWYLKATYQTYDDPSKTFEEGNYE